jgi:hypothetical protein
MNLFYIAIISILSFSIFASNFDEKRIGFTSELASHIASNRNATLDDILTRAAAFRAQMATEDGGSDASHFGKPRDIRFSLVTQIGSYPVLVALWGSFLGYDPFLLPVNSPEAHRCVQARLRATPPWLAPTGLNPNDPWHLTLYAYNIFINGETGIQSQFTERHRSGNTIYWLNPNYPLSQERASLINTATEQQMISGEGGTYSSIIAPADHAPWIARARQIFNLFKNSSTTEEEEDTVRQLGRLHYRLAVSAPYRRGSAAIAEIVVEAVARSRGLRILYPNSHIVERIVAEYRGLPLEHARNEIRSHAYVLGRLSVQELPISGRRVIHQFVQGAPSEDMFVDWYERLVQLELIEQTLPRAVRRAVARELVPERRLSLRRARQVRARQNAGVQRTTVEAEQPLQPMRSVSNNGAAAASQ